MNIVEKLDLAIKSKETGTIDGFYVVPYKDGVLHKPTYMTNEEWTAFFSAMPETARKEYGEGGGDELSEKNGRPPKMASYGSSSRMIYMLSRQKDIFHYEKKLPTTVGGKANLDGFYEEDNHYIFVEAKCHEPYTTKKVSVSKCYENLYKYINEHNPSNIYIDMEASKCGKYLNVEYFVDGKKIERFDIKQMICHLLGIATGMLKGTLKRLPTDFIYLLYDPTELDLPPQAKDEIDNIYHRTCYESNMIDFAKLFRTLLEFLQDTKYKGVMSDCEINNLVNTFTYTLAPQELYTILISHITHNKKDETFYITKDNEDGTREVVYRLKCTQEQAYTVFDYVIRAQQKERRLSNFSIRWRVIRLFDSLTDVQLCQES